MTYWLFALGDIQPPKWRAKNHSRRIEEVMSKQSKRRSESDWQFQAIPKIWVIGDHRPYGWKMLKDVESICLELSQHHLSWDTPSIHMRCHGHCDFHRFPGQLPSACSVQANGPVGFCAHWCSPSKILGVSIRKFIFTMFYLSWFIFFSISTMTTSHLFKHSAGAPSPYVWLSISPQNHQLHLGRSAMHALAPAITDRSWRTKSRRQNVDTVDTYMAKPEDTRQKNNTCIAGIRLCFIKNWEVLNTFHDQTFRTGKLANSGAFC